MKQIRVISPSSLTKTSMLDSRALPLWAAAMSQACVTCLDSECSSTASSSRDRSLKASTVATTGTNLSRHMLSYAPNDSGFYNGVQSASSCCVTPQLPHSQELAFMRCSKYRLLHNTIAWTVSSVCWHVISTAEPEHCKSRGSHSQRTVQRKQDSL